MVKGKVVIGNGGADMTGARGYVSAYDAKSGKLAWRFYTVPGDPKKPPEDEAMAMAQKTWFATPTTRSARWRHRLGFLRLRPGAESALHRRRQRFVLEY